MLKLNVNRLITMRGVKHKRTYLMNNGFTDGEARLLVSGKVKLMRLSVLTRLCTLFECTPNDLLDWQGDPSHSLGTLRKDAVPDILKLLDGKSPDELEKLLLRLRRVGRSDGDETDRA